MSLRRPLLLALSALVAIPAFGSVRLTYQLNGTAVPVSWNASSFPIAYEVDRRIVTKLGSTDAVDRAFRDWTAVPGTTISFQPAGVADNAKAGEDGINSVSITDGLFAGQNFIALTTNWYDDSAHFKEADIQIDPGVLDGSYNVEQVVEHEVGHLLGLDHSAVLSSIMYPYVGLRGVAMLDSDDKIAVTNLYPKVDPGAGATLQGRVIGDDGGVFAAQVVALNGAGEPVATALTNANGDFEMKGVPSGNYRLYAEPLDGPVDVQNLSGNWRYAKSTSFPTAFADVGSFRVDGPKIYGNLFVNASGTTDLNPKWVGTYDPASGKLTLNSTTLVLLPGQSAAIAIAGDGFVSGMTTFDVPNPSVKRVSDYTYSGNYVYATFAVAADAEPQSLVIFAKNGNQSAALTGGLRIAARGRRRAAEH